MKLRPIAYVAAGALAGIIGLVLFNAKNAPHPRPVSTVPPSSTPQAIPGHPSHGGDTPSPASASATPAPRPLPPPPEAVTDGENVQRMFRDFRTRIGGNPVGTNAEIMQSVMGGNPVQANLGPPEGQTLNDQGELLDRWGTPYFFHQLSKDSMEVRSAGPDRILWTPDDVIVR